MNAMNFMLSLYPPFVISLSLHLFTCYYLSLVNFFKLLETIVTSAIRS